MTKLEEHTLEVREKALFTKDELAEKVRVPAIVEQDLKRIISDRLEQCGIYYRVFSRTKTAASMEHKFYTKTYGEHRKLQDLVGVRINLYFDDDVNICRNIMERTFEVLEWSTSERNEDEFKPAKLNGVFRLPEYLKAEVSAATWDMYIDDTFEVQIKTIFSEGWHEIEHDMRYKGEELWSEHPGFSRYFNSILATLELCDKSMVRLFEDLGHDLYKTGQWGDMIRSHFRLKMGDVAMYPELEQVLRQDQEESVDSLAKRIYKTRKLFLAEQLLKKNRRIPINVNTIVAILNDSVFHDPRLTEIFRDRDVYNDGRDETVGESRHYELRPLIRSDVFRMRTVVDGSRIRTESGAETADISRELIFEETCACVYRWVFAKYSNLFLDMPETVCNYRNSQMGYTVETGYDPASWRMNIDVRHLDLEVGGRIWYSECLLEPEEGENGERFVFEVRNGYAEPEQEHETLEGSDMFFSYPGFYKSVVDNVGIFNGMSCHNRRRILRDDQIGEFGRALDDPERFFPVVLIISKEDEEGMMDEEWLGQFRVSDFTRTVWRYAHVFCAYEKTGIRLLKERGIQNGEDLPKMYIFWTGNEVDAYGPGDVANCSFGRHLETRDDNRTYDIVHGGQAFYHKIVTDLRDWNVSACMLKKLS